MKKAGGKLSYNLLLISGKGFSFHDGACNPLLDFYQDEYADANCDRYEPVFKADWYSAEDCVHERQVRHPDLKEDEQS